MTIDPKLFEGHTPGPWRIEEGTTVIWNVLDIDAPGTYGYGVPIAKAEVPYGKPPAHIDERRKAAHANALLIAAAPALLARVAELEGENARLREALEPLADLEKYILQDENDGHERTWSLWTRDIRRARAALGRAS